ncbi:hypothetical protein AB0880_30600 [Micromonospora chersina]
MDEGQGERRTGPPGPPGVSVFGAATARRIGAHLRYNGGLRLD